ncbi:MULTISPECIES: hypothetical protein [Streptococcus]|jgi:hypothetical protein|uniref:hypothetical protein n=1 Tax=Streptococcus TaxID=1301 RepID=UPI00146F07F7|nr:MULTISPECIES: hypothetical protein [Streptococcus]NMD84494.1 hypothetical protein [Streptococcus sp. WB01_FAA12]
MSLWDAWFGTPTEKKREQYKTLYNDLNSQLKSFKTKLKMIEGKVDSYNSSRPSMSLSIIPEDVFSDSENRVKTKVESVISNQSSDVSKLSRAVDAAYERYQYYARLAEQERREREAEARRQAEERRKRNRRRR